MSLFDSAFAPFTVALILMIVFAALEIVGALFGASLSDLADDAMPDADDALAETSVAGSLLAWLSVGRAPLLMLIVIFLTAFGALGIAGQMLIHSFSGGFLPIALMAVPALAGALYATRSGGRLIARYMPREETDAVSVDTFIGRIATIVRGDARAGFPAEAKLKDASGKVHYLLVEPDEPETVFGAGRDVLIVSRAGAVFRVIANPHASLAI